MWKSIRLCLVALFMSSISFSISPHPIFLSMASVSHKCIRLTDLVPPLFQLSWTLPLLISKMKDFFPFNVSFSCYNTCYFIYSSFIKYWRREREREREREDYEIGFGFRCIWSKLVNNIVKTWYNVSMTFGVFKSYAKGRHKAFICVICVYLYFWEVLNFCKWLRYSNVCKINFKIWNGIILNFSIQLLLYF